jgi:uncharacterized protein YcfJ
MNRSMLIGLVAGGIAATTLGAVASYKLIDRKNYAEVLAVEPVTRTVRTPRQVCHDQVVSHQAPVKDPKRVTGTVVGAVIGGVLGNQIGDGRGQDVATVAGAAAGGYAGSKIQKRTQQATTYQATETRCSTVYDTTEKADGFEVTYKLGDNTGRVHMDQHPGERIPVKDGELVLTEEPANAQG